MTRYVSILLVFFMLSPVFTPLAGAMETCGDECALGEHHECRHGKACPTHRKKSQTSHQGHIEGHGHAGHHGQHDGDAKTDKSLICTVSDTAGDEASTPEKKRACLITSGCENGKDPVSAVTGSDYLVSTSHFEPFKSTASIKPAKHDPYRGPAPSLLERPPSA